MNNLTFDLISDLHLAPDETIDWSGKATSLFCVVAGNISYDRQTLYDTLGELSNHYGSVFFIDGMLEHAKNDGEPAITNYDVLREDLDKLENVFYLHDNIVIINGVGLLATNGWCTFDFDPDSQLDTIDFLQNSGMMDPIEVASSHSMAKSDCDYFVSSIKSCQLMPDIEKIVVITNAVPRPELVEHDPSMDIEYFINRVGNNYITKCLEIDVENKISTWCFGRYAGDMDIVYENVRYVNNTAIDKDRAIYYPKLIKV